LQGKKRKKDTVLHYLVFSHQGGRPKEKETETEIRTRTDKEGSTTQGHKKKKKAGEKKEGRERD